MYSFLLGGFGTDICIPSNAQRPNVSHGTAGTMDAIISIRLLAYLTLLLPCFKYNPRILHTSNCVKIIDTTKTDLPLNHTTRSNTNLASFTFPRFRQAPNKENRAGQ
eukprot:c22758_g15_i1 orf=49-369(-)